jgi:predicted secreted protein
MACVVILLCYDYQKGNEMILREQDSGRSVQVKQGETFSLRLAENPTTGYRWSVVSSGRLELVSDQNEAGVGIGAGGVRVIRWVARKVGSYDLILKHWREWEGEGSVIGRFQASVVVEEE